MRISDWSADVCSSDLLGRAERLREDRRLLETAGQSLPSVAGGEGERHTFLRQRRRDFADRVAAEIGVDERGLARPVRAELHRAGDRSGRSDAVAPCGRQFPFDLHTHDRIALTHTDASPTPTRRPTRTRTTNGGG